MTKKDYIKFANVLKFYVVTMKLSDSIRMIANDLCDIFIEDNPRFDKDKFLEACEIFPKP